MSSARIVVDTESATPPFEQVRQRYAELIVSAELVAGTRLPTVRALAAELGLAVNTVARAYRELETAGLVETRGRAGTVVSARGDASRAALVTAAGQFADLSRSLGVPAHEALELVRAALA